MSGRDVDDADELSFGQWRILPRRRELMTQQGESVALGSRAFDLLLSLVEGRGALLTKEDLIRRVWGGSSVSENNVQVQMSAVRKALGEDAARLIANIPGRGYRFTGLVEECGAAPAPARPQAGRHGHLHGTFACYSHAQSVYYRSRLIRGAVEIGPQGDGSLSATYCQALPTGRVEARGTALLGDRTLSLMLTMLNVGAPPPLMHLVRPSVPGSVLAGHMIGAAMLSPDGQPPYATRIVMVRVPASMEALERSNRYLAVGEDGLLSADLAALGLRIADPAGLDAQLQAFLRPACERTGTDQVAGASYAMLAAACDRCWFDTLLAREDEGAVAEGRNVRGRESRDTTTI